MRILLSTWITFILLAVPATAQTVDGRFQTSLDGNELAVTLQLRANPQAEVGTSTLQFFFNSSGLSFPASPSKGTDYVFHRFDGSSSGTGTYSSNVTRPRSDKISVNIVFAPSGATGDVLPTSYTDVVTLYFQVTDPGQTGGLSWSLTEVFSTDNVTMLSNGSYADADPALDPPNTAPSIISSPEKSLEVGTPYSYTVEATDDDGDPLSFSLSTKPDWLSLTDNGDGTATLSGTPTSTGTFDVVLIVSDGNGGTDDQSFTISVTAANVAPTAVDDAVETDEDTPVTIDVLANDNDPDGTLDPASVSVVDPPEHGSAVVENDGSITYTPEADFSGEDRFTYTVDDDDAAGSNTATVSVTVHAVAGNAAPTAALIETSTDEDESITIDILAEASDPDGDDLVITGADDGQHGTTEVNSNAGTITYTPDDNFYGEDSFEYTIVDPHGASAQGTVNITIHSVNDVPVLTSTPVQSARTGDTYMYEAEATDIEGDALSFSLAIKPTWLSLTDHGTGKATVSGIPTSAGTFDVQLTVTDAHGGADHQRFTINVSATNVAPTAVDDAVETDEDTPVTIDVLANDNDPDGTLDPASVSVVDPPEHGSAVVENDGSITYTPEADFSGEDRFTYTVDDDDAAGSNTATVSVTVLEVNDPPGKPSLITPQDEAEIVITGDPSTQFVIEWTPVSDPEGEEVSYTWQLATEQQLDTGGGFPAEATVFNRNVGTATQLSLDFGAVATMLTDQGVEVNTSTTLFHRVIASDGEVETTSDPFQFTVTRGTIVSTDTPDDLPDAFRLLGNYPNPFNPSTTISFDLPAPATVTLRVYDPAGRLVMTLPGGSFGAGSSRILEVDASALSSGLYLYHLRAEMRDQTVTRSGSMTVIK